MSKELEALKKICEECQKYKGKFQVACPFRSISNEYCEEYEIIAKKLEVTEIVTKALKYGIYGSMYGEIPDDINRIFYIRNRELKVSIDNNDNLCFLFQVGQFDYTVYYLKDHGKTWALTKEGFKIE